MGTISNRTLEGRCRWQQKLAERDARIIAEWKKGKPIKVIAYEFCRSYERVRFVIHRHKNSA